MSDAVYKEALEVCRKAYAEAVQRREELEKELVEIEDRMMKLHRVITTLGAILGEEVPESLPADLIENVRRRRRKKK